MQCAVRNDGRYKSADSAKRDVTVLLCAVCTYFYKVAYHERSLPARALYEATLGTVATLHILHRDVCMRKLKIYKNKPFASFLETSIRDSVNMKFPAEKVFLSTMSLSS